MFSLWLIAIISVFLVWLPFYSKNQMERVFANFDGPNYLVISKCWYNQDCIGKNFSLPLPLEYYPAHFPGYPALIGLFNLVLPGWWAILTANLVGNILLISAAYLLLKQLKIKSAFWLSLISLFLPARIFVLRSVGAPETLFLGTVLFSIFFYRKKKYLPAGIFLAIAQTIKTPAIILFLAYFLETFLKNKFDFKKYLPKLPLLLGPLVTLPIFYLFKVQTGDFWAYFNSGDNRHLFFPPFQTFISSRSWLGDFWLEDIIYIYLIGGLAVLNLIKKYKQKVIALFPALFYLATLFVVHRDISRYSIPLYFFWLISFRKLLQKKEFKIIFWLIVPAVYLYTINFINYNIAPIADWTPYR